MHRNYKSIFVLFISGFLLNLNPVCRTNDRNTSKMNDVSGNINDTMHTEDVTVQQLKAQIYLFKEALDQYGATRPEQAVELWVRGFERRNGVFQYSVLCDKLKKEFIKDRGEAPNSFWIVGGSSPWLQENEIVSNKKLTDSSYEITVKLHWVAAGYSEFETRTFTIINENNKWCIRDIK